MKSYAITGLLLALASESYGGIVHVKVGPDYGGGITRLRGQECFVITPAHVVARPVPIEIVRRGLQTTSANKLKEYPDDLAILRLEDVTACTEPPPAEAANIDGLLEKSMSGVLKRTTAGGGVSQQTAKIVFYNERVLQIEGPTFEKGDSGSMLLVENQLVGMLLTVGRAIRWDYAMRVVAGFFDLPERKLENSFEQFLLATSSRGGRNPFDDPRVREAIRGFLLFGGGGTSEIDIERAKKLLWEAGYPVSEQERLSVSLSLSRFAGSEQEARDIRDSLKHIHVDVHIDP